MKLNEYEALLTQRVLLVPYSAHHVPTYHKWMQDPDLQQATASEALSLPEEYAMQKSWRIDADKLTFIACTPPPQERSNIHPKRGISHITATKDDAAGSMIGDINLFLAVDDSDEDEQADAKPSDSMAEKSKEKNSSHPIMGEIEIMIASRMHRGKGLGKEILLTFMWYILSSVEDIVQEYCEGLLGGKTENYLKYLRVKIDKSNSRSVSLFESVGFKKLSEEPNYFGELELRRSVTSSSILEVEASLEVIPVIVAYR